MTKEFFPMSLYFELIIVNERYVAFLHKWDDGNDDDIRI
jgi:hypothetical protein